jgi:pimeloyl-ACP methyl ester carboxylesterase
MTKTKHQKHLPSDVKTVLVNGYELAFVEHGSGAAVVMVHGAVSDYRHWTPQLGPLGRNYRAVSVSLRHSWPDQWNGEGPAFSIQQHAKDFAAFIEKLSAGPAHVVGHSLGADVALLLAASRPELVRSLVLAEPAPLNEMLPKTQEFWTWLVNRRRTFEAAVKSLEQGGLEAGVGAFIDAVSEPGGWDRIPTRQKRIFLDNAWSIKGIVKDVESPFGCAEARAIEAPALLVKGGKCGRAYDEMMDELAHCLRRCERVTIPNAPHAMNLSHPRAFNTAVLDFLARH